MWKQAHTIWDFGMQHPCRWSRPTCVMWNTMETMGVWICFSHLRLLGRLQCGQKQTCSVHLSDLFLESTNQSELQRSKHSNELEVLEAVIKVDPKTQACHHSVCNFTVSFMFWSGHLRFVCCLHSWTAEKVLRGTCCVVVISARIAGFRGSWGFNSPLSLEIFGKMDQSP